LRWRGRELRLLAWSDGCATPRAIRSGVLAQRSATVPFWSYASQFRPRAIDVAEPVHEALLPEVVVTEAVAATTDIPQFGKD
jgi:hypothetical protein